MRALLSSIGSRGDVQPLVGLAVRLRAIGVDSCLCVPPDFRAWIEQLEFPVTPMGPELRSTGKTSPSAAPPTEEQRRRMIEGTIATQFETIMTAAADCDVIVGATALQVAAPSVAEKLGIPYVFAAYSPNVLPSRNHAPPVLTMIGDRPVPPIDDYTDLWVEDARRWNETWMAPINAQRESLGLLPIHDVRGHVLTDQPWLAADPVLAPWPNSLNGSVFQPGAWLLPDDRPLSAEVEAFLASGEPPSYFGFGSMRAPENLSQVMIASARALGRRAILSRGWADLSLPDSEPDCLLIGEINQRALFRRVASVVHHGGAGTTTAATLSGVPQVVIPQHYDQLYWAGRVQQLEVGVAHAPGAPDVDSLTSALRQALSFDVIGRARYIATLMRDDGAQVAAERLLEIASSGR